MAETWFDKLPTEEQHFVKQFLLASGSLKEMAQYYDVSYPTVRNRLNALIGRVQALDEPESEFKQAIRQMVLDDQLDLAVAKQILAMHDAEKEN